MPIYQTINHMLLQKKGNLLINLNQSWIKHESPTKHKHKWKLTYIYTHIYVMHSISFQIFLGAFTIAVNYVIAIHLMRWLTHFYDFSFKGTATAWIGIQPTKAWLSHLVNFKNAIRTLGRTVCNKIIFYTWKKCHRNVWKASDCFWSILQESSISFGVA